MSIEAIIDRIIGDAKKEAERIMSEGRKKTDEAEKAGKTDIEDIRSRILQKAEEESKQKKERLKIAARMEFKKGELEEKQNAISLTFNLALKELQELSKTEYQEMIEAEFLRAEGIEEVVIPPDEKRIDEEFLDRINKLLIKKGKKGNLKLSNERRPIPGGGFILKKDNIENNNASSILLESVRNQIELRIAEILFKE